MKSFSKSHNPKSKQSSHNDKKINYDGLYPHRTTFIETMVMTKQYSQYLIFI